MAGFIFGDYDPNGVLTLEAGREYIDIHQRVKYRQKRSPSGSKWEVVAKDIFITLSSTSGGSWGSITGSLSDQADLQAALNSKENFITPGTNLQYRRGDKTWQTLNTTAVPEGARLYWTNTRTVNSTLGTIAPANTAVADGDAIYVAIDKLQGQMNAREVALTFSTGLTRATNTITADLSTGKAGGQTAVGGTASAENLILSSTSNSTKGYVGVTNAPRGTALYPSFAIGSGGFAGSATHFTGHASGTSFGINTASAFAGNAIDVQVAGTSILSLNASTAHLGVGMGATALTYRLQVKNTGTVNTAYFEGSRGTTTITAGQNLNITTTSNGQDNQITLTSVANTNNRNRILFVQGTSSFQVGWGRPANANPVYFYYGFSGSTSDGATYGGFRFGGTNSDFAWGFVDNVANTNKFDFWCGANTVTGGMGIWNTTGMAGSSLRMWLDGTGGTANAVFSHNTTTAIKISSLGDTLFFGRSEWAKGADVAAANDLTLGSGGNSFTITGNTQINAITTLNWQAGSVIILEFSGAPTIKHNNAGSAGTAVFKLAGSVDLVAAAETVLTVYYNGTNFQEIARKVA